MKYLILLLAIVVHSQWYDDYSWYEQDTMHVRDILTATGLEASNIEDITTSVADSVTELYQGVARNYLRWRVTSLKLYADPVATSDVKVTIPATAMLNLHRMKTLDVYGLALKAIPDKGGGFKYIKIRHCNFDSVNYSWNAYADLEYLEVSDCPLTYIDDVVFAHSGSSLDTLKINRTPLSNMSNVDNFRGYSATCLDLSNNALTYEGLPEYFYSGNLYDTTTAVINLDSNYIDSMPDISSSLDWCRKYVVHGIDFLNYQKIDDSAVSTSSRKNYLLKVFPNPCLHSFKVTGQGILSVNVFDTKGTLISTSLDKVVLPASGFYCCRVRTTDGVFVKQIISIK